MATLDDLVADLHADAPLDARGEFSLDAEKAREKLRKFQLAVPEHYVLLLVEAAALRGASLVDLMVDSDDVYLRFDGEAFAAAELDDLYAAIFAESASPTIRARQRLAIAINAAMSMKPSFIKVATPEAELTLRPEQADAIEVRASKRRHTQIHVRDRVRPGLLFEFVKSLRDRLLEANVVRERCRYSDAPIRIRVNEHELERSNPGAELLFSSAIDVPGGRGYAGFVPAPSGIPPRATLDIVTSEVWISRHDFDAPDGMALWVYTHALAKDVSQADVVQDDRYRALLSDLAKARAQAIVDMIDALGRGQAPAWAETSLRAWMLKTLPRGAGAGIRADMALNAIASLPLWPTLAGPPKTTLDILDAGKVWTTREVELDAVNLRELADVVVTDDAGEAFLGARLDVKVHDATRRIRGAVARERNRRAWRARPHDGTLGQHRFIAMETFEAGHYKGAVGLRLSGSVKPACLVVVDDCVLEEIDLPGPAPGLFAFVAGPFIPKADYSGVRRERPLALALIHLLAAIERMFASLADCVPLELRKHRDVRAVVLHYIEQIVADDAIHAFLVDTGFPKTFASRYVRDADVDPLPKWNLPQATDGDDDAEADVDATPAGADEAAAEAPDAPPHPLARSRLFPMIDGEARSLVDLAERRADGEPLWWLTTEASGLEDEVLYLKPPLRRWIEATLGGDALSDYRPRLEQLELRRRFLAKPTLALSLPSVAVEHRHKHGSAEILWGLRWARDQTTKTTTPIRVLKGRRPLGIRDLDVLLPGLTAAVNDDEVAPTRTWDGFTWDDNPELVAALDQGLCALLTRALAEIHGARGPIHESIARVLLALPAAVYTTPELRPLHGRLRAELGDEAGDELLAELLRLCKGIYNPRYFRRILRKILDRPAKEVRAGVDEALRSVRDRGPGDRRTIRLAAALVHLLPPTLEAPLLRTVAGAPCTLGQVFAQLDDLGQIRYIEARASTYGYTDENGPILRLDAAELELLRPLIPDGRLVDASAWLTDWAARRRFEERPQVEVIAINEHLKLVGVPLEHSVFSGEVALAREFPSDRPSARISFFKERRAITTVQLGDFPVAMHAAIEVDHTESGGDYDSVSGDELKDAIKLCRKRIPDLIGRLAAEYDALPQELRGIARAWALHLLSDRIPRLGGLGNMARVRRNHAVGALLRLPLLRTCNGEPRSMNDLLADYQSTQQLRFSREPIAAAPDAVVVDADAAPLIFKLFPKRVDMARELKRIAAGEARRERAPALRSEPPTTALASKRIASKELLGHLWIARDPTPGRALASVIDFGDRGKVVEGRELVAPLQVAGALEGKAVEVDEAWERVDLERRYRRRIRRAARALWRDLISEYRRGIAELTGSGSADPAVTERLSLLRDALWIQLLILRAAREESALDKSLRSLIDELQDLDLLPLHNQRLISLNRALEEQPPELLYLGMWQPRPEPAPEPEPEPGPEPEPEPWPEPEPEPEPRPDPDPEPDPGPEPEPLPEPEPEPEPELPPEPVPEPDPEPPPDPEPEPEPPPPPEPAPEELLIDALCNELRLVREHTRGPLRDAHLELITFSRGAGLCLMETHGSHYVLDVAHPLVVAARDHGGDDPTLISMLASGVYTFLNHHLIEIEDEHEAVFHRHHCEHILKTLAGA